MHLALHPFIEPPRFRWRYVVIGVSAGLLASALVLRHVGQIAPPEDKPGRLRHLKPQIAHVFETTTRYAAEALPRWIRAHPGVACPSSPADLDGYLSRPARVDPWGGRYVIDCDVRGGLYVWSLGLDGVRSGDDLRHL